ncbi:MAG TPA: hypothetical protein ACFYD1_09660 [Candidatus Hypogeohydataceae bacterium YC38]|nr:hypothetical protein [Candidatus Brocadiales bacterium]
MRRTLFILTLLGVFSTPAWARQCDLEWQTPKKVAYEGTNYILWFYQIKNNAQENILVPIEVFLATDTGGRYVDRYQPEVEAQVSPKESASGRYENSFTMAGEFLPGQTKKAIAYFENVDEDAREIYIYVTGLSHYFFWRWRKVESSYRITYRRAGEGWELVEHGFTKDTTHRDYESWMDTYPEASTPGGPRRPMGVYPDSEPQDKAPKGPEGRRLSDIEDFIEVQDAIYNADKIKSPRKALNLWEAITDSQNYREINMDFLEKVYTWEEVRQKNKEFLEDNHARITGEPFEEPSQALWQSSKVDGYKELGNGELLVYARFARLYEKEYHYGLVILKIKNTAPYFPIPKWNQYPYNSRWKVCEYRWRHISKPDYNKKLFAGYPKVIR